MAAQTLIQYCKVEWRGGIDSVLVSCTQRVSDSVGLAKYEFERCMLSGLVTHHSTTSTTNASSAKCDHVSGQLLKVSGSHL